MKKLLSVLLALVFCCSVFVACSSDNDKLFFELNEAKDGYIVAGINTAMLDGPEELVIPSKYEGLPVTEIEKNAFMECENLVSVEIPNSITKIGSSAFAECVNLSAVNIPNSVTEIGDTVF